jgi:predicted aspartyl protease
MRESVNSHYRGEAGKHPPVKKGESFLSSLHMPHIFGSLSVNSQEQTKVDVGILIDTGASDSFISENCLKRLDIDMERSH